MQGEAPSFTPASTTHKAQAPNAKAFFAAAEVETAADKTPVGPVACSSNAKAPFTTDQPTPSSAKSTPLSPASRPSPPNVVPPSAVKVPTSLRSSRYKCATGAADSGTEGGELSKTGRANVGVATKAAASKANMDRLQSLLAALGS